MAGGDETRSDPGPSLFGDDRPGGDRATTENRIPPPRPAGSAGTRRDPMDETTRPASAPTILARPASEWESGFEELDSTRVNRGGLIALFVLALVTVVIIALGLAAWSAFQGESDSSEQNVDAGSSTTLAPAVEGEGGEVLPDAADGTGSAGTSESADSDVAGSVIGGLGQLRVTVTEEAFVCNGETREFAMIAGAEPNEVISFESPQASSIRSGTADASGELPIRWNCDPDRAGTTWELTATGETSEKTVTFLFAGVAAPAPPPPEPLTVQVTENPFACDGGTRVFATLSGADPNEQIDFESPQASSIRSGTADAAGQLPIRWNCDTAQAGTTWDLTATGVESGRSVTFSFTGS